MNVPHAGTMFVVVMVSVLSIITIIVLWITCTCTRRMYEQGQLDVAIWWLKIVYFGKLPVLKRTQDSVKLVEAGQAGDETAC